MPPGESGSQIDGLKAYAESLQAQFERMTTKGPEIQQKAREVQVTEKSRDGLVSVTVGARGELVRLDLDPRIYRRPDSRELADAITETVHAAQASAKEQVMEVFAEIIPRKQLDLQVDGDFDNTLESITALMQGKEQL